MPDADGYPTQEELQSILDFKGSPAAFVHYVNSIWWHEGFTVKKGRDTIFEKAVKRCYISTWGWSGNEDTIIELRQTWFWMRYWRSSRRGGHYEFEVPADEWSRSTDHIGAIFENRKAGDWLDPATRKQLLQIIEEAKDKDLPLTYITKKVTEP